jgi:hypothetical protein
LVKKQPVQALFSQLIEFAAKVLNWKTVYLGFRLSTVIGRLPPSRQTRRRTRLPLAFLLNSTAASALRTGS